ncbi:hypothetical protein RU97_GL000135 [Enterococcus canis]|uniref:Membrane protein NfeD2 N-terminal transmembrane domain-containing protein n=1 Tax=Enterococcus canis TaxID=214095 RepID=A0A1L8RJM8_9ENTE|nr:hypothetical protein [Enterococcus canis]OJG19902.1 hypothetical protein RU97_GL000135 [Enterococcus canis]
MIFGLAITTVYFYCLIICAIIAVLLVLFGDIFDFDGPFDPMLIIPWLAFTSLFGYLGETLMDWSHWLIFILAALLASALVFLLNFYVLMPMRNAESTISISEKSMEGAIATVITTIPLHGMGEIQYKSVTGSMSRPASFYAPQEEEAKSGSQVLIIEVRERVCYVVPYKGTFEL